MASGEGVADYEMDLVSLALRFKDPAALPGFAYLGIQMARDVEDFVATQGSASLPYLDSAWTKEPDARPDIMETWAIMVGEQRNRITAVERIQLLRRLLQAADSEQMGFDDAAEVLDTLTAIRAAMSPAQLHADLTDWLQAICLNATGERGHSAAR
ncbi:MAG TPA: hypothetical protein VFW98_17370 [Gemmatimonadaceae bacterium]|nr:hypothetical protein [Gemmatimonadaceae bacterium]